ncbi:MAG: hypothetical protein A2W25_04340 [candidate division Zixibacteria bacterium RBG_16_53_22]|nr:MAG: hypothetical protein A2W25_04340 [candidate division Zixibacteria bacterium RBG_16_53_22]
MSINLSKGAPCPTCGHKLDRATPVGFPAPSVNPGDITVCAYCADVLVVLDTDGNLRKMTEQEEIALEDDTRERLSYIQLVIKNHGRRA